MNDTEQIKTLQALTEVARDRERPRKGLRLATVRVSPGSYFAVASVLTFVSALLLRSDRDLLALTAVAVVLTGIMGAIIVTPLMNRMGITDFRARGFAVGVAAHGIGTARAFQVDVVAGVFAGIAMSLNALVTSLLVPVAVTLLVR